MFWRSIHCCFPMVCLCCVYFKICTGGKINGIWCFSWHKTSTSGNCWLVRNSSNKSCDTHSRTAHPPHKKKRTPSSRDGMIKGSLWSWCCPRKTHRKNITTMHIHHLNQTKKLNSWRQLIWWTMSRSLFKKGAGCGLRTHSQPIDLSKRLDWIWSLERGVAAWVCGPYALYTRESGGKKKETRNYKPFFGVIFMSIDWGHFSLVLNVNILYLLWLIFFCSWNSIFKRTLTRVTQSMTWNWSTSGAIWHGWDKYGL